MLKLSRGALALGAVFFAFFLAGCGGSVPSGDVFKVDSTTTSKQTFERWLGIAARSSAQGGKATVPDPPKFTACIAAAKAAATKPVRGQATPTDKQYLAQCKTQYESIKSQVMTFLVRAQWLEAEAAKEGIKISDAQVKTAFDKVRRQQFPNAADYTNYLKTSGVTEADLLFRQRTQMLEQKITTKLNADLPKVTDAAVLAYYNKNHAKQFTQPASRDLTVVLTKDKATADKAKAALEGGASWASVVKRYSVDPTSKASGGKLTNVTQGQGEKAFEQAVFGAQPGKTVYGPVKTADGYYVFKVDAARPQKDIPLDAALKASIRQILVSQNQQNALKTFGADYQKRWRSKTECAKDYTVPDCKNGKKAATTATTAATQQGG